VLPRLCLFCMHELCVCGGALLCFFAYKLADTCCYLCVKNMDGVQLYVATCYLFVQQKRREKREEVGPACRGARASRHSRRVKGPNMARGG